MITDSFDDNLVNITFNKELKLKYSYQTVPLGKNLLFSCCIKE